MSERKRLMIIDDDPEYVAATRAVLEGAGYETDVAYNPREGLAALRARRHDLLLLDLLMGRGAEGVTVARVIRADAALKKLPILVVTGLRTQLASIFPRRAVHADDIPLDDLVEKPVTPEALLERVAALLHPAATAQPVS
ncbi:MAG TPA: response regulator [Gemmatimonadales bacterium]|nr:response regulator [Gemmatimonadales bacterium]